MRIFRSPVRSDCASMVAPPSMCIAVNSTTCAPGNTCGQRLYSFLSGFNSFTGSTVPPPEGIRERIPSKPFSAAMILPSSP